MKTSSTLAVSSAGLTVPFSKKFHKHSLLFDCIALIMLGQAARHI